MHGHDPRLLILLAFLLDGFGQLLILGLILWPPSFLEGFFGGVSLDGQLSWLLFSLLLYPLLSWLFGSYTVLRWRRLSLPVLFHRLVITSVVCVMVVVVASWLFNPPNDVWLLHRRVQLVWMLGLTGWSFIVRLALRRGLLLLTLLVCFCWRSRMKLIQSSLPGAAFLTVSVFHRWVCLVFRGVWIILSSRC